MIKSKIQLILFCTLFSLIVLTLLVILFLTRIVSAIYFKSILIGVIIPIINFTIGFILIRFSHNKSENVFLISLWGGLLFRLVFGLVLTLITLIFLEINTYGFIFSILFFYVFYLLIEIFYLNLGRKSQFGSK